MAKTEKSGKAKKKRVKKMKKMKATEAMKATDAMENTKRVEKSETLGETKKTKTAKKTKKAKTAKMTERFYIAYGSNLSTAQMDVRTPDAVVVGTATLDGWRLLFRKYATIEKAEGYSVPVAIWKISAKDEKRLDRYEGFPKFYGKEELTVTVTALDGSEIGPLSAMVYIMTPEAVQLRDEEPIPSIYYYFTLLGGYKKFGFDAQVLRDAFIEAALLQRKMENRREVKCLD